MRAPEIQKAMTQTTPDLLPLTAWWGRWTFWSKCCVVNAADVGTCGTLWQDRMGWGAWLFQFVGTKKITPSFSVHAGRHLNGITSAVISDLVWGYWNLNFPCEWSETGDQLGERDSSLGPNGCLGSSRLYEAQVNQAGVWYKFRKQFYSCLRSYRENLEVHLGWLLISCRNFLTENYRTLV